MARFLSTESYWARGRPVDTIARLIREATRVVGLFHGASQVGFARIVSDGAAFAYLADVYVLPDHRARGLGTELVREAVERGPQDRLRWLLHTADAHELYARFGFGPPSATLIERPPDSVVTLRRLIGGRGGRTSAFREHPSFATRQSSPKQPYRMRRAHDSEQWPT